LNGIAVLNSNSWRRLPRRVSLFLGCAALSVLFSPSSWGVNELLRLLSGVAFFYTAGPLLAEPRRFDYFAKRLLLVCSVPVVLSFLQLAGALPYTYWDWIDGVRIGRISGGYQSPVSLVYLFVFLFPLALYVANRKSQTSAVRQFAWFLVASMSVVLAFTYHRVGYVTIVTEVFLWLYLSGRRNGIRIFLLVIVISAILSFNFLQVLYAPAQVFGTETDANSSGEFLRGRGMQWYLYMDSYVSSGPFHWVMGLGGSVIPSVLWEDPADNPLSPDEAHNDYIRILHAYGLVGLLLYLSILVAFWRRALQLLRSTNSFARELARIMLPALVGVMILSVTTEPMRYPTEVWYLFGLGAALFYVRVKPERLSHNSRV
jgi:O-antigen ligase